MLISSSAAFHRVLLGSLANLVILVPGVQDAYLLKINNYCNINTSYTDNEVLIKNKKDAAVLSLLYIKSIYPYEKYIDIRLTNTILFHNLWITTLRPPRPFSGGLKTVMLCRQNGLVAHYSAEQ